VAVQIRAVVVQIRAGVVQILEAPYQVLQSLQDFQSDHIDSDKAVQLHPSVERLSPVVMPLVVVLLVVMMLVLQEIENQLVGQWQTPAKRPKWPTSAS